MIRLGLVLVQVEGGSLGRDFFPDLRIRSKR